MRNLTKALTVVSLLAPVSGHSLGIGDIRVRSALNQNLNAEISLVASRGEDPSNIKVSLAPPEKFDEAGVPWSYFLSKLKFQPIVKPNGSMVIKVTSREALKEPYLNFLVEVSWPKGNLYREFTVLVDPPADYQPAYREPVYQEPAYPLSSNYENYPSQQQEPVLRHRPARQHTVRPRHSSEGSFGGQIVTRRNDTLWNVAERARGAGVSVEQMMIALYEKNPHAFYQQNVNALSAGKTLNIPEKDVVQQTSRQQALAEFGRHNDAWRNNRTGVPAGERQVAKEEPVDNQLKLEAPAETTVAANETVSPSSEQTSGVKNAESTQSAAPVTPGTQQQTAPTKESAKETPAPVDEALQSKVAALEKQMAMMQELIALKDKQLAELQNPKQTTTTPPAPTQPTQVAPPVAPVTTPAKPEQPIQKPVVTEQTPPTVLTKPTPPAVTQKPIQPKKPPVKPVLQQPVVEEPESPLPWILGGLVAILASLFGWLWWRKKKILQDTEAESMFRNYSSMRNSESTGPFSTTRKTKSASSESSFLNEFKASDFETFESFNVDHGDIDPVAEADVYLAYGRYQQAEDLIRQAIKDFPERDDCKLKLLEVFHANSRKEDFESYAFELASAGKKEDKEFWLKVSELSRDICPDSELFSIPVSSNAAVFPTEPETLTENVLFTASPGEQPENPKPIPESEYQGAATFEVTEVDSEQSLFDASNQESQVQNQSHDEPKIEGAKPESQSDEPDFDLSFLEEDLRAGGDNETLDFDLGPYPGATKSTEPEKPSPTETKDAINNESKLKIDDIEDKTEVESYEFDFNTDKAEIDKPVKSDTIPANDTWEPEQTLEFSIDSLPETDTFGNDMVDFSFDLESTQVSPEKEADQDFFVSDLTDMDEMETKLDLAKAYIDMGDPSSAKDIIGQVLEKGTADQKKTAQLLLDDLG